MKNNMMDLHNHLMEQLEVILDRDLTGDKLAEEITRTKAVMEISREMISNANLCLRTRQFVTGTSFSGNVALPPMLELKDNAKT